MPSFTLSAADYVTIVIYTLVVMPSACIPLPLPDSLLEDWVAEG